MQSSLGNRWLWIAGRGWTARAALRFWLAAGALAALAAATLAPVVGSAWVRLLFQAVCHQRPERALWIGGAPTALCARCLGIYAGAATALLFGKAGLEAGAPVLAGYRGRLAAALLLLFADVASEALGWRPAWAPGRVLTGWLAGAAAAPFILRALEEALRQPSARQAKEQVHS